MVMCSIVVVGIVAAFFAPETRGKALKEWSGGNSSGSLGKALVTPELRF